MNELVSIIIPVYNTSKYLNMCLDSVVNQTYQKLQIILVDDGSTDSSPQLCDEWTKKDERIEVIHKSNEGLGYTRNAGLNVARGEFVSFLDSDDTIECDTVQECVKVLCEQKADACYYGRKTQLADGNTAINYNIPDKLIYSKEEVKREFACRYFGSLPDRSGLDYIQASACCGMYRRSIITYNHILFRSERECMSEDTFFNLDVCNYATKVIIIPKDFYNYTYNEQSLTRKYNEKKFEQMKNYYRLLQKYTLQYREIQDVDVRVSYAFYVYLRQIIEYEVHAYRLIGIRMVYSNIKRICSDSFVRENLKKTPVNLLDKKRKFFLKAVADKAVVILLLYYLFLKRK